MANKRGAELAISTLVIIVIAVVVLIVIIVGFTTGWSKLWGNITAFFGSSNVDSIAKACETACLTQSKNDWCNELRTVIGVSDITSPKKCEELKTQTKYGFKACPAITC